MHKSTGCHHLAQPIRAVVKMVDILLCVLWEIATSRRRLMRIAVKRRVRSWSTSRKARPKFTAKLKRALHRTTNCADPKFDRKRFRRYSSATRLIALTGSVVLPQLVNYYFDNNAPAHHTEFPAADSRLCSPSELPRLGVDLHLLAGIDEVRDFDLETGFQPCRLERASAGGISAHARFGVFDR